MDHKDINLYLSRILSGYYTFLYNQKKYKLIYPDTHIKYEAELYAAEVYESNKFNEWITDEEILDFLISNNLWTFDGDISLKNISDNIDNTKVELYQSLLNPSKIKFLRRQLSNQTYLYNTRYHIRHSFDHLTIDGYSNLLKSQYILLHSIYDSKDNLIFDIDNENIDFKVINDMNDIVVNNSIDIKVFRQIARSDLWRSYWSANKNNVFSKSTIDWSDEQKTLVVLTKMYDSAYEHPECPPDDVFEDDDMFDGWMILQKRENEKAKSKHRSEKLLEGKKLGNAGEVFLVANSREEAQNIYNLNDASTRGIIRERENILSSTTSPIQESQLPDVQRDLLIEKNRQIMESRRK